MFSAVYNCRAKWHNLCLILGVSNDDLSAIKNDQSDSSDDCLREGLDRWLRGGDYDTKKHGRPTWRSLVEAVANPAGGDDHALAMDIAEKHKSELHYMYINNFVKARYEHSLASYPIPSSHQ